MGALVYPALLHRRPSPPRSGKEYMWNTCATLLASMFHELLDATLLQPCLGLASPVKFTGWSSGSQTFKESTLLSSFQEINAYK